MFQVYHLPTFDLGGDSCVGWPVGAPGVCSLSSYYNRQFFKSYQPTDVIRRGQRRSCYEPTLEAVGFIFSYWSGLPAATRLRAGRRCELWRIFITQGPAQPLWHRQLGTESHLRSGSHSNTPKKRFGSFFGLAFIREPALVCPLRPHPSDPRDYLSTTYPTPKSLSKLKDHSTTLQRSFGNYIVQSKCFLYS